LFGTDG
jgi:nucleoside-diphosphate kinase